MMHSSSSVHTATVCVCAHACNMGKRERVTTLHLWEWIMCQSGLQVACRAAALQRGGRKAGKGSSTLETLMVLNWAIPASERTLQRAPYRTTRSTISPAFPLSPSSLTLITCLFPQCCHTMYLFLEHISLERKHIKTKFNTLNKLESYFFLQLFDCKHVGMMTVVSRQKVWELNVKIL